MEPFIRFDRSLRSYCSDIAMLSGLVISNFFMSCIFSVESKYILNNRSIENYDIEPKIVGGVAVPLERYPFAIQFFNLGALCGGVIMNSWAVLTSAHCLDVNQDLSEMTIQVGSRYIYDFNALRYQVSSFVVHEDYAKEIPFQCDIALVFSVKQMVLGQLAKKGILVNTGEWMNKAEKRFVVTGWGWTKYGGSVSETGLMMTELRYVPVQECSRLHQIKLTDDMFCLYGSGRHDTCKGDSGGGVLWKGMIVGLTSHGDGCAKKNKPSVYTNVWYLREWIRKQVTNYVTMYCSNNSMTEKDNLIYL